MALAEERQRLLVDIKKRQEVEGQLRQAKDEAERRANEAEEARAALKDREHRLQYEAQLKDEFLATLAHELRNPLAPLRNVSEILRLEALSDTARQATGVMDRQIAQLVRLIDDLMDVSRITRGHLTLQRETDRPADDHRERGRDRAAAAHRRRRQPVDRDPAAAAACSTSMRRASRRSS